MNACRIVFDSAARQIQARWNGQVQTIAHFSTDSERAELLAKLTGWAEAYRSAVEQSDTNKHLRRVGDEIGAWLNGSVGMLK